MAKGHFQFRPKDGAILSWLRQQAQKDKRSLNGWMEVHFENLKHRQENPETVLDIIHRIAHEPRAVITKAQTARWRPILEAIHEKIDRVDPPQLNINEL